jgi:proline dehydrogenase
MKIPSYFARRFVAGETAYEAVEAVKELNRDGIVATLDLLGENVSTHAQADEAVEEYYRLFDLISRSNIQSGVSLKLTQFGLDLDVNACVERMRKVLSSAQKHRLFVRIDMEGSFYTQITVDVFVKLAVEFTNVGLVLQAYLHRSMDDAKTMADQKFSIRVCKGAYKESTSIAFHNMDDIRTQYKNMVKILLDGGSKIGIATHDDHLINWARDYVTENKVPKSQFEFQMLYGLRRKKSLELVKQGFRVRSYVPYGTHWFPYFYRRLRERKENILFVLKSLIAD